MKRQVRRYLIIEEGVGKGQRIELTDAVYTLGRTTDNTMVIDDPRISRHHTRLQFTAAGDILEDLGSTNGTWLNRVRIISSARISHDDVFSLADCITLRYVMETITGDEATTVRLPLNAPNALTPPVMKMDLDERAVLQDAVESEAQRPAAQAEIVQETLAGPLPAEEPVSETQPSLWVRRGYALAALLLILICLTLTIGVFLWFAPAELFRWLGIPLPVTCFPATVVMCV